ncbi:MAG: prepilin-type N-terminal cleavage/methylation domain-containing protein [Planctomycetota bacterium]
MNSRPCIVSDSRAGFSLLEVLVACGILVVGLASIAAILPAAGSRLSEAAAQDRAGTAAAVAMSEIRCRGLVSKNMSGTTVAGLASKTATVFGQTLSLAVSGPLTVVGVPTGSTAPVILTSGTLFSVLGSSSNAIFTAPDSVFMNARISNDTTSTGRGYFLEDEVQYTPSSTGDLPLNWFVNGVRQFNRGVCWGAMVTPLPAGTTTTGSMNAAKVSVAVFRKPDGAATAMLLTSSTSGTTAATGIFQLSGTDTPASLQRTLLKPCSTVLAIPRSGTAAPQWLAIRSSWIAGTNPLSTLASATTCVVFENSALVAPLVSGSTLTVIGFENLLLVNEQTFSVQ